MRKTRANRPSLLHLELIHTNLHLRRPYDSSFFNLEDWPKFSFQLSNIPIFTNFIACLMLMSFKFEDLQSVIRNFCEKCTKNEPQENLKSRLRLIKQFLSSLGLHLSQQRPAVDEVFCPGLSSCLTQG